MSFHFRAFRFEWYMYKKKVKKRLLLIFLSAKAAEGGGGSELSGLAIPYSYRADTEIPTHQRGLIYP